MTFRLRDLRIMLRLLAPLNITMLDYGYTNMNSHHFSHTERLFIPRHLYKLSSTPLVPPRLLDRCLPAIPATLLRRRSPILCLLDSERGCDRDKGGDRGRSFLAPAAKKKIDRRLRSSGFSSASVGDAGDWVES